MGGFRLSIKEKIAYLVLAFGSSLFVVKGFTWDMGLPKFYFASVLLSLIFVLVGLKLSKETKEIRFPFPLIGMVIFGIYAVVSSLMLFFTIPEVMLTSLGFALNLLLFALFSVYLSNKSMDAILWLLQAFVFAGLVLAGDAMMGFYGGTSILWNSGTTILNRMSLGSVVGNVNFTSNFMGMLLPIAFYLSITKRKIWKYDKLRPWIYTICFGILLSVVMASQTRGVYYGIIGSIFVILIGLIIRLIQRKGKLLEGYIKLWNLLVVLVVAVFVIWGYSTDSFLTGGSFSASERLTYVSEDNTSVDMRMLQWKAALEQWKTSKIFGTGFGSYKYLSTENMGKVIEEEPKYMYVSGQNSNRTHQEYIQMLGETGILGVALIIISLLLLIIYYFKVILSKNDDEKLFLFLALAASFSVIILHSVVSFPSHLMPNALFGVVVLGCALSKEFLTKEIMIKKIESKVVLPLFLVFVSLAASVFMSRNFFAEGYFTKAYIDYQNINSASAQSPDLLNTISRLRKEIKSLEEYSGDYTYLATDTYIEKRVTELRLEYPEAPPELIEEKASDERVGAYNSRMDKLNGKIKGAADALQNLRNVVNDSYYHGADMLDGSLNMSDGVGITKAYMGYFDLLPGNGDDFFLTIMNSPDETKIELLKENFEKSAENYFLDFSKRRTLIRSMMKSLDCHRYLEELPLLIEKASRNSDLSTILNEINIKELYQYEMLWQSTDWLISSLQIAPDIQVMRNISNNYFKALNSSRAIANNLENIRIYLDGKDKITLHKLITNIKILPYSLREEMEYIFDILININPGGWGISSGLESMYFEYIQKLLLLYGYEDSIDRVLELAEKELFACDYMKTTHWGIPDKTFSLLTSLTAGMEGNEKEVFTQKILELYEANYEWNRDNTEKFKETKVDTREGNEKAKYENVYNRLLAYVDDYEKLLQK